MPWGTNHLLTNTAAGGGDEELAAADQSFESSDSSDSSGYGVEAGMEVHSPSDNSVGDGGTLLNLNQNENQVAAAGMDPNDNAAYAASLLTHNRPNILGETVMTSSTVSPPVPQENQHYMASRFFQLKGQCKRARISRLRVLGSTLSK